MGWDGPPSYYSEEVFQLSEGKVKYEKLDDELTWD